MAQSYSTGNWSPPSWGSEPGMFETALEPQSKRGPPPMNTPPNKATDTHFFTQ